MHFAISATWGPTDPTRAMLPFIFASTALAAGDSVTLMLFHDAVHMATQGTAAKIVPVGPPQRYEEAVSHPNATVLVCKPCVEVRHIGEAALDPRVKMAGMDAFHAAASQEGARVVAF